MDITHVENFLEEFMTKPCLYCDDGQATIVNIHDPYDRRKTICPCCNGSGEEMTDFVFESKFGKYIDRLGRCSGRKHE